MKTEKVTLVPNKVKKFKLIAVLKKMFAILVSYFS